MAKLAVAAGVVLVGVLVLAFVTSTAWYRLWRYRRDPDSVVVYEPPLCSRGPAVLPAIYDAFEAHGGDADVGKFRLAVVAELRCLRRHQGDVVSADNERRDLPEDRRLFETIVRAWNQEPSAEIRDDMRTFMSELDFRAWYAIWAGIQSGPHPSDRAGLTEVPSQQSEPMRAEWCRVVRPVVLQLIESRDHLDDAELELELGRAHCDDADVAVLQQLAFMPGQAGFGAMEGLFAAVRTPERAQQILVPLVADCAHARTLATYAAGELDGPVAAVLAPALAKCPGACGTAAECQASLTRVPSR